MGRSSIGGRAPTTVPLIPQLTSQLVARTWDGRQLEYDSKLLKLLATHLLTAVFLVGRERSSVGPHERSDGHIGVSCSKDEICRPAVLRQERTAWRSRSLGKQGVWLHFSLRSSMRRVSRAPHCVENTPDYAHQRSIWPGYLREELPQLSRRESIKLDQIDCKILQAVQINCRATSEELSQIAHLSKTAVQRRLVRLREAGVSVKSQLSSRNPSDDRSP